MADVNGGLTDLTSQYASGDLDRTRPGSFYNIISDYAQAEKDRTRTGSVYGLTGAPGSVNATLYAMRGRDVDCMGIVYRTWVVENTPDFTGAQYTGPRCGVTPFTEVVVTSTWIDTR